MKDQRYIKAIAGLILAWLMLFTPLSARAATESVTLEDLRVFDVILLPTVRSARDITFTKPKTWQVSGSSYIYVEFQHSIELLPERSYLQIAVNGQTVKQIALTKENAKRTAIQVPLPVAILKDTNTLSFRVEQHYTYQCEDPLDKSLWTQIHPESKIVFEYTPTLPVIDLKDFPYPIIDPLSYGDTHVRYILPEKPTEKELHAMSLVNVYMAQATGVKGLVTDVGRAYYQSKEQEHLVYIGTPDNNPDVARLVSAHSGGQSISNGLVLLTAHPQYKNRGILVVAGNSDESVLKAAQFISTLPKSGNLKGAAAGVPGGWNAPRARTSKVPRFIDRDSRTFKELGFTTQQVHKIYAPPIVYDVPVVSDFRRQNGKLFLELDYSYSPKLNPLFSSLELRLNDISIANIPLMNEEGEENKHVKVPVPLDILRTNNQIVAQFHLMPDKYGRCKNNYEDNAWGRIMDTSKLRVEGGVTSLLPSVGLLNRTGYPYSKVDNLKDTHFVIAGDPTPAMIKALLGVTTRLGRVTQSDTDLQFGFTMGKSVPGDKNVVAIQNPRAALDVRGDFRLDWLPGANIARRFVLADEPKTVQLFDNGDVAYLEQFMNGGDHVLTLLSATTEKGFSGLDTLFETDKLFERLRMGTLKQLSLLDYTDINDVSNEPFHAEKAPEKKNWWDAFVGWMHSIPWAWVFGGLFALFALLIILPVALHRMRQQ